MTASPVSVSVTDDETSSSSVMLSLDRSSVGEGGGPQVVTVTASLGGAPFAVPGDSDGDGGGRHGIVGIGRLHGIAEHPSRS